MDEIQEFSPHPHGKKGMERERGGHIQVTVYLYETCWVSINRGGLPIVILFEILISYCPFEVDKMNINYMYVETCEQISVIINSVRCLTSILVDVQLVNGSYKGLALIVNPVYIQRHQAYCNLLSCIDFINKLNKTNKLTSYHPYMYMYIHVDSKWS